MINLNDLHLFTVIYQTGSLSQACQQLNLSIATASRRQSHFEKSLNTQLFYRHKTGVTPTLQH
ncbi:helix-turn-helix domain-containing protein [Nicoletella semolina]|uniref:helix-turn-helix domain-containing protein n=1 Tax=Nicoletella semolina TaxID=271160 RepID=UPI00104CEEAB|nr:LysR family transcriptional regulator [Nicoletella semolina]